MNEFLKLTEAHLKIRCETCHGLGQCDDADSGDISFSTWLCSDCKGTGIKAGSYTSTREMIQGFNLAFERPVNDSVVQLSVSERELLGKLIMEECVEYCTKGLGLGVWLRGSQGRHVTAETIDSGERWLDVELNEGQRYDPIESADGLGDMNVVIHFNAHWHGFNLDDVTYEINESNMSKLDENGQPIINQCRHWMTQDELIAAQDETRAYCQNQLMGRDECDETHHMIDPTKPVGKILKSKNYFPPDIGGVIYKDEMLRRFKQGDHIIHKQKPSAEWVDVKCSVCGTESSPIWHSQVIADGAIDTCDSCFNKGEVK